MGTAKQSKQQQAKLAQARLHLARLRNRKAIIEAEIEVAQLQHQAQMEHLTNERDQLPHQIGQAQSVVAHLEQFTKPAEAEGQADPQAS